MKKITDKVILTLCCLMLFSGADSEVIPVAAFLGVMAVSSLSQVCSGRIIPFAAQLLYMIGCIIEPQFFGFAPVVLYDTLYSRSWWMCAAAGLVIVPELKTLELWRLFMLGTFIVLAVILQRRTSALTDAERRLVEVRDSSAEVNMLLSLKNKTLRENQDNEVRLATLSERNRIAREIHDNVGHLLSRSLLQVGALQVITDEKLRSDGLVGLSVTLNNAMTSIRQSVHDLHDDSIDLRQSAADALKPLKEKGITVNCELDASAGIPVNIRLCIISIIKECVSNIIKHSSADRVSVILREHPAFYQLMVEDNGCCDGTIAENGIGLINMRERAESLGGIFKASSGKNGFKVFVTLKKENEDHHENSNS